MRHDLDFRVGVVGAELGVYFERVTVDSDGTVTRAALDISSASPLQILLKKPGSAGEVLTKTASLDTDGTDGIAVYTTLAADLDTAGVWTIQGTATIAGKVWYTEPQRFEVGSNLA